MLSPDETTGRSVPSTTRQETALSGVGQRPEPTEGASPAAAAWQHDLDADASQATVPSPAPSPRPLRDRAGAVLDEHLRSTMKFLVVGGLVFLLDAAMYNLLVFWHPTEGWGHGLLHGTPLTAKVLTIAAASCLTYLGNRLWTFADRPRPETTRSIMLFILVNLIATGLQLACLAFSRYVLGLDSPLADNISGTFIGQIVSTSFRYVTYGRLVFPKR